MTPPKGDPRGDDPLWYYRGTAQGDLIRLCFADSAGSHLSDPYAPETLVEFDKDHTYRAFRQQGTLFLASGYAFVAFGAGGFFDAVVAKHMRRHYFQIGLLAQHELAALLAFSSRITRVVAIHRPEAHPDEALEVAMHEIEDDYLDFVHRFHFTGASNQVQAGVINRLIRRHLRLDEIFDDLHRELTSATQYMFNRAASRAAATTEHLSFIGLFGVVGSITVALLSLTILAERDRLQSEVGVLREVIRGFLLGGGPPCAATGGGTFFGRFLDQAMLLGLAGGLTLLAAAGLMAWMRWARIKAQAGFWEEAAGGAPTGRRLTPRSPLFDRAGRWFVLAGGGLLGLGLVRLVAGAVCSG